jgi:hypothetical protein
MRSRNVHTGKQSRMFLREAGLGDWFGVIPAVVEFRRFPGELSEQLRKRPRLHLTPG